MATQKGRNWSSGDIVTAANLSSIERGVSAVAEEYTPTTWTNGNTVTAAALNNIEQGIANSGGGSSDFSTAEVTVVNNSVNEVELPIIYVDSTPMGDVLLSSVAYIAAQDTQTINAVLYNNNALVDVYGLNASVSGNASIGNDTLIITGDCTITIS